MGNGESREFIEHVNNGFQRTGQSFEALDDRFTNSNAELEERQRVQSNRIVELRAASQAVQDRLGAAENVFHQSLGGVLERLAAVENGLQGGGVELQTMQRRLDAADLALQRSQTETMDSLQAMQLRLDAADTAVAEQTVASGRVAGLEIDHQSMMRRFDVTETAVAELAVATEPRLVGLEAAMQDVQTRLSTTEERAASVPHRAAVLETELRDTLAFALGEQTAAMDRRAAGLETDLHDTLAFAIGEQAAEMERRAAGLQADFQAAAAAVIEEQAAVMGRGAPAGLMERLAVVEADNQALRAWSNRVAHSADIDELRSKVESQQIAICGILVVMAILTMTMWATIVYWGAKVFRCCNVGKRGGKESGDEAAVNCLESPESVQIFSDGDLGTTALVGGDCDADAESQSVPNEEAGAPRRDSV